MIGPYRKGILCPSDVWTSPAVHLLAVLTLLPNLPYTVWPYPPTPAGSSPAVHCWSLVSTDRTVIRRTLSQPARYPAVHLPYTGHLRTLLTALYFPVRTPSVPDLQPPDLPYTTDSWPVVYSLDRFARLTCLTSFDHSR